MYIKPNYCSYIYSIFPYSKNILEITTNNIISHVDNDYKNKILYSDTTKNNNIISKSYNILKKNINLTCFCTIIVAAVSGLFSYVYIYDKI